MFTLFAMGHKKRFLRHAVTDNRTIKKSSKPPHNYENETILFVRCNPESIRRLRGTDPNPTLYLAIFISILSSESSDGKQQSPL